MGYEERKKLIQKIEKARGTKVITYVVTTRPKINAMIEPSDLRIIYDHLEQFKGQKIDLFIYSNGGVSTVAWALANLIREHASEFTVLVPSNAFSCATSIAIGADKIIMGKMGTLGPIDPTVANEFNPMINNQPVGISVEDMAGYLSLLKEKFGISDTTNLARSFEQLAADIRPLALGNAYRHYIKCRDDARKLLLLHMDPKQDKDTINKIISVLVEKLYYHGHHINRIEAEGIGLKVEAPSDPVHGLMWDLFKDYESEMKLQIPYTDELPSDDSTNCYIPVKYIESTRGSDEHVIEQTWVNLNFDEGAKLVVHNGQQAVFLPPNNIIPASFYGQAVFLNGQIYDKRETSFWR